MMFYTVRHHTRFRYSAPIQENVMEVRMQPCTDALQQCLSFELHLRPTARIYSYQDHLGNLVNHFNIPGLHNELSIRAEALVKVTPPPALPAALAPEDWDRLDALPLTHEHWEMRTPSRFTERTRALDELAQELGVERRVDPLTVLLELSQALNRTFEYAPAATRVDSPIDEAILLRRGVCQDYTHILLALLRNYLRIPCRYVSGYLYHRQADRSAADATHAWVEALLPELGWVGVDPTNNVLAGERHIRVAVGRDYSDVPPTHGIFKGLAASELSVSVHVRKTDDPDLQEADAADLTLVAEPSIISFAPAPDINQQQQQQQQ
jgi:transglutaminase-like putative cysteine protease